MILQFGVKRSMAWKLLNELTKEGAIQMVANNGKTSKKTYYIPIDHSYLDLVFSI